MKSITFTKPFAYKNFRLFIGSELSYRSGLWILCLVFSLLIKQLHPESTFYQGLLGFLYNLPMFLFTPITGLLSDRFKRLNILRVMQFAFMLPAIALLINLFIGKPALWLIYCAAFFTGICFSVAIPAIQAFVVNTIPNKDDVGAGVSVFSSLNRAWQFVGYALGGFIYSVFGVITCSFTVIAANVVSLVLLLKINVKETPHIKKSKPFNDIARGFEYIKNNFPIKVMIILVAINGFFGYSYIFQIAIVNGNYLHGTPQTLGYLLAIGGAGALSAGLVMSFRKNTLYLTRFIRIALCVSVLSFMFFSFLDSVWPAYFAIFALDFGITMLIIATVTFIQKLCSDEVRGRVMGTFTMANLGMIPLGSLLYYGLLGEWFGPMHLFQVSSVVMLFTLIVFSFNLKKLRKIAGPVMVSNGLIDDESEQYKI